MIGSAGQFSCPTGMGGKQELLRMTIHNSEWQNLGMTIIWNEILVSIKYFFEKIKALEHFSVDQEVFVL